MTDHPDIVERLQLRMLVQHGGPKGMDYGWNLQEYDSEMHREAAAEITRLRAEAEAMGKDAERYRWLRDRLFGADWDWNNEGVPVVLFRWPDGASIGADLDAAIDAAKGTT